MAPCATYEITYVDPMGDQQKTRIDATCSQYALRTFLISVGPAKVLSVTEVIPASTRGRWVRS